MAIPEIKKIFRPSFFWDADKIDPEKHAAYVIARILDYGAIEDVRRLKKIYSDRLIMEVIRARKGLSPRTGKYWALRYHIPLKEVACLRKYYSPGH